MLNCIGSFRRLLLPISCLLLARAGAPGIDAETVIASVERAQWPWANSRVVYKAWRETGSDQNPESYKVDRIAYGGDVHIEEVGVWGGREPMRSSRILRGGSRFSWNTWGNPDYRFGSIRGAGEDYMPLLLQRHSGWLFGYADTDAQPVWDILRKNLGEVVVEETDRPDRVRLSLNLEAPPQEFELLVSPSHAFRVEEFYYHVSLNQDGSRADSTLTETPYWTEARFAVEEFQEFQGMFFPKTARADVAFSFPGSDGPTSQTWRLEVSKAEPLVDPPAPETFAMRWPPHTTVSDSASSETVQRFYADENGELTPLHKIGVGEAMPPIRGEWLDKDRSVDLERLAGKFVVIYDWALWCSGCHETLKQLQEAVKRVNGSHDVTFFAINPYDDAARLRAALEEYQVSTPHLVGEGAKIAKNKLGAIGAGNAYLFGPDGTLMRYNDFWPKDLDKIIADTNATD